MDINPEAGSRNYSVVVVHGTLFTIRNNYWLFDFQQSRERKRLRIQYEDNCYFALPLKDKVWPKRINFCWPTQTFLLTENKKKCVAANFSAISGIRYSLIFAKITTFCKRIYFQTILSIRTTPIKSKENGVSTNTPLDLTNDCWYLLTKQPFLKMVISYPENC